MALLYSSSGSDAERQRQRLTEKDFLVICFYDTSRVLNSTLGTEYSWRVLLPAAAVVGLTLIATVRQSFLMGTRHDEIVIIAVGSVEIAHHGLDDYLGMSVCL